MAITFRIALSAFDKYRKCTSFCGVLSSGDVLRELRIKLVVKPLLMLLKAMNLLCMLLKDRVYGRDVRLASQTLEMISHCVMPHMKIKR